jgi:hypothetical protein
MASVISVTLENIREIGRNGQKKVPRDDEKRSQELSRQLQQIGFSVQNCHSGVTGTKRAPLLCM